MRKFLGVVFILLGVLTSIPVLLTWALRGTLLTSTPWKSALVEARVYERVLEELPAVILSDPNNLGEALASAPVSAADLADVVQAIVPATLLQDTVERGFDMAFRLVHGEVQWEQAALVVQLQDIKRRAPVEIQNLLIKKVQALPTCTEAQLKAYNQRKDLNSVLPPCKPKGVDVRALVSASVPVQDITKAIPESIDLLAEIRKSAATPQPCPSGQVQASAYTNSAPCAAPKDISASIAQAQAKLVQGFTAHLYITILAALFFIGTFLLFLPNLRSSFRWLGVGLVIAGAGNSALALFARSQVGRPIPEPSDQVAQTAMDIFLPVARNLGSQLSQRLFLVSALVLVAGIIAFVVSYAWKPKEK
ncbi:MAG: hypothetical protein AAB445_01750 [Patescibacteria group bacterium]